MAMEIATIADIKQELECKRGCDIRLVVQVGRKKQTEQHGILAETYHSIFIVDLDQNSNSCDRVSYSYTDILTNAVEVHFANS